MKPHQPEAKETDIQKQRAILSNLLAKLNITGYESKDLLPEPMPRRKIQPNLNERRTRRASSHSLFPRTEKAISEAPAKSADDFLLKPRTAQKEGLISLHPKAEEKKGPALQKHKAQVPRFFDAGGAANATMGTPKGKIAGEEKEKRAEQPWISDEMQPYAPVTLPFGGEKVDTPSVLTEPEAKGKDEIFLMQFPRVLSIVPKEDAKKKVPEDYKDQQSAFDLFKQIKGKIGKLKVYKSGKMEMEIEGIKYTIDKGIQSKMRQEVAVVDKDCRDIYLLGEVMKKMVITPNIDSLLGTDQ